MSEQIAEILALCLERMEAGASLESCLADFPLQAAELAPLLRMTQEMKPLTEVGPRPAFAQNARLQLESQLLRSERAVTFEQRNRRRRGEPKFFRQRRFSMSMLQFVVAAVLALTATTGGVAYAANASNPGDPLHSLDLAMESVQLNLAPDISAKVQLRLQFASERLAEAQATFSDNDVADGLEAVNEYGTEISAIAQLIGSADGADQEALASLVETAQGVHKDVLTQLLEKVPEQAKESIQKALDASSPPSELPASAPENAGPPAGVGAPEGAGNPNGTGNPNNTNSADNSNTNGNSNGVDNPGVDIRACANSLSQENAQALADLAKEHGVDYQYVLENFCALGTVERVQEMLSERQGPPTDVPAGPPTEAPAGPPTDVPAGPPADHPGRP